MCIPYVLVNNLLWNWLLHIRAIAEGYCFTFCIYLIRLLLCLSKPGSLPAQDPSQPEIPVKPRSQSARDPSQPKIPVSPRSQSALDALMPIWLMSIRYLTHTYLIFGSCLSGIWPAVSFFLPWFAVAMLLFLVGIFLLHYWIHDTNSAS